MKIVAILLAAGLSRRMGVENKLLLKFGQTSMVASVVDQLVASPVSEVIVVVGHEAVKLQDAIAGREISVILNDQYHTGMTSSIQAGVAKLPKDTDAFMICLSDMPMIRTHHYTELINAYLNQPSTDHFILRPKVGSTYGHPVIFHNTYIESVLQCIDSDGCSSVISAHKDKCISYHSVESAYIRDVDTPQDKQWINTTYDRRKR